MSESRVVFTRFGLLGALSALTCGNRDGFTELVVEVRPDNSAILSVEDFNEAAKVSVPCSLESGDGFVMAVNLFKFYSIVKSLESYAVTVVFHPSDQLRSESQCEILGVRSLVSAKIGARASRSFGNELEKQHVGYTVITYPTTLRMLASRCVVDPYSKVALYARPKVIGAVVSALDAEYYTEFSCISVDSVDVGKIIYGKSMACVESVMKLYENSPECACHVKLSETKCECLVAEGEAEGGAYVSVGGVEGSSGLLGVRSQIQTGFDVYSHSALAKFSVGNFMTSGIRESVEPCRAICGTSNDYLKPVQICLEKNRVNTVFIKSSNGLMESCEASVDADMCQVESDISITVDGTSLGLLFGLCCLSPSRANFVIAYDAEKKRKALYFSCANIWARVLENDRWRSS